MYDYQDEINFVYIDIDNNNDISLSMNVTSVPYGILLQVIDNNIVELGRIKFTTKLFENTRLLRNLIRNNLEKLGK